MVGLCLLLVALLTITATHAAPGPVKERSYLLFNQDPGTNPYQYLAWTPDSSVVSWAEKGVPGLFMARSKADVVPPRSLWMFDPQSDGTHRIYAVDNTYGGQPKRLDVRSEGNDPFLWDINTGSQGQKWQLYAHPDGVSLQIYNPYWSKALDIDSVGGRTKAQGKNAIWMNGVTNNSLLGQKWQLADWTPTISLTATRIVTQYQSITPAPTIVYVGGQVVTSTVTSTIDVTETVQVTSVRQVTVAKRDAFTIPTPTTISRTVATTTVTSTSLTTLSPFTSYVTTSGGINTQVIFSTRTVQTTVTAIVSQINRVQTLSSADAATISVAGPAVSIAQSVTDVKSTTSSTQISSATASGSNTPAPGPPGNESNTALIAGLAAGLGALFFALIGVVLIFLRRHKKKNDENVVTNYLPVRPAERKEELPGDSRVVSGVSTIGVPWQEMSTAEQGEREKLQHPQSAELEGGFHATVSPSDYMAPDTNITGYGHEGRYELSTTR